MLNWVYWKLLENRDEKGRAQLEMDLNRPLPGQEPAQVTKGPWSEEEMAASFNSALASFGGRVR